MKRLFAQDAVKQRAPTGHATRSNITKCLERGASWNYNEARGRLGKSAGGGFPLSSAIAGLDLTKVAGIQNRDAIQKGYFYFAKPGLNFEPQGHDLIKLSADVTIKLNGFGVLTDKVARSMTLVLVQFRKAFVLTDYEARILLQLAHNHYDRFKEFQGASYEILDLAERAPRAGRSAVVHRFDPSRAVTDEALSDFVQPIVDAVRLMRADGDQWAASFESSTAQSSPGFF